MVANLLHAIRRFRQENNLTQQELAAFLGVSQKTISRWEQGVDRPSPEARARLTLLLGDGSGSRLPLVFEAVRDAAIPLALVDNDGRVLVASPSFSGDGRRRPAAAGGTADTTDMPTVLVIEDDDGVRKATRAVLKRWRFLSVGVADGEAAVQMVRDGSVRPAAAIVDFLLPGRLDGVDAAMALREVLPDLAVLLVSGEATPQRMRKIAGSGLPFIPKPVDPEKVKMLLLSLLPRSGEAGV